MIIPIKIECDCGQHYAFDHDAENGQMAFAAVACPTCGVDGTPVANAIIAKSTQPAAVATATAKPAVRIHIQAAPAAAPTVALRAAAASPATAAARPSTARVGFISPEQAKIEARAKIFWGSTPEEVIYSLRVNGLSAEEAKEFVDEILLERRQTLRGIGIKKIVVGIGLLCVPVGAGIYFAVVQMLHIQLFGIAIAIGVWGACKFVKGVMMLVAPKLETGDVADQ